VSVHEGAGCWRLRDGGKRAALLVVHQFGVDHLNRGDGVGH
jgi:hypothetical protein